MITYLLNFCLGNILENLCSRVTPSDVKVASSVNDLLGSISTVKSFDWAEFPNDSSLRLLQRLEVRLLQRLEVRKQLATSLSLIHLTTWLVFLLLTLELMFPYFHSSNREAASPVPIINYAKSSFEPLQVLSPRFEHSSLVL